jgi:hypothetical protein
VSLSYRRVFELARGTGLSREGAIIATAIAAAESGLDPHAVGDTSLTTSKWGPSIGLWQIRSLRAERGTGGTRDETKLRDPAFNARSMHAISGGGVNWSPWSVYTSGSYNKHMAAAREAAGSSSSTIEAPKPNATQAGWTDYPGAIGQYGRDLLSDSTVGDVGDAVAGRLAEVARQLLPYAAALTLGVALVGVGVWKTVT